MKVERQWLTLGQIKAEYASNDYTPELLLQHLLHHVEASPASVPAPIEHEPLRADESMSEQVNRYHYAMGWNACRDAMLAAAPTPPSTEDRKDAERYHKLVNYMIGDRFDLDDALVAAASKDEMSAILDAMQEDKP